MCKKYFKRNIILISFLILVQNSSFASYLWNIDTGIENIRKDDFENAKNYLENYIISNPNDKEGYFWLGKTYMSLKDLKQAQKNLKKAYNLMAENCDIEKINFNLEYQDSIQDYFDMASFYFDNGDIDEASQYADMILKSARTAQVHILSKQELRR